MNRQQFKDTLYEISRQKDLKAFKRLLGDIDESGDSNQAFLIVGDFIGHSNPRELNRDALLLLRASINSALEIKEGGG